MTKLKHFCWYQLPAIFWLSAIFIQSSISNLSTPDFGFKLQDKLTHLIEFGILAYLLIRAFMFQNNHFFKTNAIWATFIFASLYAVTDELHQLLVPGRAGDIYDVFADILGIVVVIILFKYWEKLKNWKNQAVKKKKTNAGKIIRN